MIHQFTFLSLISVSLSAQQWNSVGNNGMVGGGVTCFYPYDKLYIGSNCSAPCTFSGLPIRGVCSLQGNVVDTLGEGLTAGYAKDAAWFNNRLVVVGPFAYAEYWPGVSGTINIAVWDSVTGWSSITPNGGTNSSVEEVEVFNGDLYIAGVISNVNGVPCDRIARWNGTTWSNVAGGVNGSSEHIFCMTVYHGQLYVGGDFTQAGSVPAYCIARWNGSTWDSVAGGLNGPPLSLVVDTVRDVLYAGGWFTQADGIASMGIAEWNDTVWKPVGSGFDTLSDTRCMTMFNGQLFAGGGYSTITSQGDTLKYIYTFNGTKWVGVDGGANLPVYEMAVYNGNLYVGGNFNQVGYGMFANRIACYGTSCPTSVGVDEQPPPIPFSMYPNPNDNELHITSQDPGELIFRLYNPLGQLVKEEKFRNKIDYSTSELTAGTYTVQVSLEDGSRAHSETLIIK